MVIYKDKPAVNVNAVNLVDSISFKVKVTDQTDNNSTKNAEIMAPSKYLSIFWRTLEMPLINYEINLILT